MNERIRELELEAIAYADSKVPINDRYNDIYHSIVRGKFAELIVRECAELIDNKEMITALQTYDEVFVAKYDTKEQCSKQILEHFGVLE